MEEDECDFRSPIGKIIKHINSLCKKPPIDNQLSEAIDTFNETLNEQDRYLENGIFKINFAESALFLQSCTELYGKEVDLLWNQLLEFHTRLVKYDYEHEKENGAPINQEAIEKLEERRNRYLRKKNFKLIQEEQQQTNTEEVQPQPLSSKVEDYCDYLIHEKGAPCEEDTEILTPPEEDKNCIKLWETIKSETKEYTKYPYIVYKQMTQTYNLENTLEMQSWDFDIMDLEDEEFNTKYSRVPGWRHIQHLIEYNDKGMLPDRDSTIAKLKLKLHGKFEFLHSRNIPIDTPFEEYKAEYIKFCNEFLRAEAKKWQNMPLNTLEDYRKQLEFLADMHKKNCMDGSTVKTAGQHVIGDKINIIDTSDEDSLLEPSLNPRKEFSKTDLCVRLEKLSNDVINSKLRSDSGFFDFTDDESEHSDDCADKSRTDVSAASTDISMNITKDKENCTQKTIANEDGSTVCINNTDNINCAATLDNQVEDNFDTRSIASDHDYCLMPPVITDIVYSCNNTTIVNNNEVLDKTVVEEVFKKPCNANRARKIVKTRELSSKRQKINKENEQDGPPLKRRKLSQKQIAALAKSKITPVKLLRFEKFFSENYQAEEGEGEVPHVQYDPDSTEEQNLNDSDLEPPDLDDVRSIYSDHAYCQPRPSTPVANDSGIFEASNLSLESDNRGEQLDITSQLIVDEEFDFEKECQKLLAASQENPNKKGSTRIEPVPTVLTEEDFKKKEKEEMRVRVQEWRDRINPVLRNLKENDFDIHEYGSRIMENMEINETKPFKNIVEGKSSAEVVRFFISSLQLANTNNIEICGAKSGQLSNDTYDVKLLSKDRYHEHLNDYLAPSEESLEEKLEKVRAMKMQQETLGTSKTNRAKLTEMKTSKGKRLFQENVNKECAIKVAKLSSNSSLQRQHSNSPIDTYQQNKENRDGSISQRQEKVWKGKSIIRKQINTSHILSFDISQPSTSRQDSFDIHMPSTSSQMPSHYNTDIRERDLSNAYETSPNKRARKESLEMFVDRLAVAQNINPHVQMHSTPSTSTNVPPSAQDSVLF